MPERSASAPRPQLPERYHLRRHIASGGMATVWCADDRVLDRKVAIKIIAERFADDRVAVLRFKREARAAARVGTHAHVVTVYDVGDLEAEPGHDGGRAFLVMEYLGGGTVADAIRVGAVRRQESVRWLSEAAAALDHAHARGIVHRDVKPANFLLDRSRVLHVADFGIARMVSEDTITSSEQLFGTAAYLSPEQALGRDATSASDRYALAVAAFELLAGERPFAAPHFAAQARQHIEDEPPSASARDRSLPPAIDAVLQRGMAKEPAARFATGSEFVDELRNALTPAPVVKRALPRPDAGRRRPAPGTRAPTTSALRRPPASQAAT
ncbi:MAG: serine/threonine-protein kinase, partial [Solirubrobacteraceae bacterium]